MKMNTIAKEIFKFLNIIPNEVFRISDSKNYYKINEDLQLLYVTSKKDADKGLWTLCGPHLTIANLLVEKSTIKKIIAPNEKEQLAINYAKACGCNWIAKNASGKIYAYDLKPVRSVTIWSRIDAKIVEIDIPISFLSWNDEEPYYIGDKE